MEQISTTKKARNNPPRPQPLATLAPLTGALRNGAPFTDWNLPSAMTRLRERLAKHTDGDRQFVEILTMVALYGLEAVTEACAAALEEHVVTSAHGGDPVCL